MSVEQAEQSLTAATNLEDYFEHYDKNVYSAHVMQVASRIGSDMSNAKRAGRLALMEIVRAVPNLTVYYEVNAHRLSARVKRYLKANMAALDELLHRNKDLNYFDHDLFSASTLIQKYLLRPDYGEDPTETPLMMYLRVAIHIHATDDLSDPRVFNLISDTCVDLALHRYTQATPTLFNAGLNSSQCSSCFLIEVDDSLDSILQTGLYDAGIISKHNGGLGIGIGRLRHSPIESTASMADGVISVGRLIDKLVQYVKQGNRNGAATVHLPIWHKDIMEFIAATDNFSTSQTLRFKNLNTSIWMNDLFFKRVEVRGKWTVFCPTKSQLFGLYNEEFEREYVRMEELAAVRDEEFKAASAAYSAAKTIALQHPQDHEAVCAATAALEFKRAARRRVIDHVVYDACELLDAICRTEISSGFPYIMHGDAVNEKSNQANIGVVNSSNLCVTGDTKILTLEHGYIGIADAVRNAKTVNVWNGEAWSPVVPRKTSRGARIVRVVLSNGQFVDCTREHKFIAADTHSFIPASKLTRGTQLANANLPVWQYERVEHTSMEHPYTSGFFAGCGTEDDAGVKTCVLHTFKMKQLVTHLAVADDDDAVVYGIDTLGQTNSGSSDVMATVRLSEGVSPKTAVPTNAPLRCRLEWLAGLLDARGVLVTKPGHSENKTCRTQAIITSRDNKFLQEVQLMLTTVGIASSCVSSSDRVEGGVPLDFEAATGNRKRKRTTDDSEWWRLTLEPRDVLHMRGLGVKTRYITLPNLSNDEMAELQSLNDCPPPLSVASVEDSGRVEPTYCFTEHSRHAGVFNGVLTGQCQEITEVATPKSIASCNLASISLKAFVTKAYHGEQQTTALADDETDNDIVRRIAQSGAFDFEGLAQAARSCVRNINGVIDHNTYPVPNKTHDTNVDTRPLGIGVSGLDDAVKLLDLTFESRETAALNKAVFACMYHAALSESVELAKEYGEYPSFRTGTFRSADGTVYSGSPVANGKLQFDLWRERAERLRAAGQLHEDVYCSADDEPIDPTAWSDKAVSWDDLRSAAQTHGVRNSMLLAVMPTASTAQILRNSETTEVHTTNLYSRTVQNGNFVVLNQHLVNDLEAIGLWDDNVYEYLVAFEGSLAHFERFLDDHDYKLAEPTRQRVQYLSIKYKTMFEISQKVILRMARQRGIYIDQSQSTNVFLADPTVTQMRGVHKFAWKLGLKTGIYYLRQKLGTTGAAFSLSPEMLRYVRERDAQQQPAQQRQPAQQQQADSSSRRASAAPPPQPPGECDMCGS